MRVWKRRLVALVAVGAGSAGLMSTAGAQTPPTIPDFTIPSFTLPTFTIPPPTMPPSSTVTTSPPPTMPPPTATTTTPPPTMPPTTFPSTSIPTPPTIPPVSDQLEEFFEDLIDRFEEGGETFEELRAILDEIIASF